MLCFYPHLTHALGVHHPGLQPAKLYHPWKAHQCSNDLHCRISNCLVFYFRRLEDPFTTRLCNPRGFFSRQTRSNTAQSCTLIATPKQCLLPPRALGDLWNIPRFGTPDNNSNSSCGKQYCTHITKVWPFLYPTWILTVSMHRTHASQAF